MAKDVKASSKRARERGDAAAEHVRRAERSAAKRLRRLESALAIAMKDEARRRRQLSAAESAMRQAAGGLAGFAATVGEAGAAAAQVALATARERLMAMAGEGSQAANDAVVILGGNAPEGVAPEPEVAHEASAEPVAPPSTGAGSSPRSPRRRSPVATEGAPRPARRPRTRTATASVTPPSSTGGGASAEDVDETPAARRSLRRPPDARHGASG